MKIETADIQNIAGHQTIRLPDDLRINDNKVYVKKMGDVIYLSILRGKVFLKASPDFRKIL